MTRLFVAVFGMFCLVCLGCGSGGPDLGQVTGTVTMDGKPLANAVVTFVPTAGGRSSTGTTDESGKYTLGYVDRPGALVGMHNVKVTTGTAGAAIDPSLAQSSDSEAYAKHATGRDKSAYDKATVTEKIPAKYNTQTTLSFDVKPGSNKYDIPMTSK